MSNGLGIYIHIPFCVKKCLYCDFLSAPAKLPVQEEYVKKLLSEIEQESVKYRVYSVDTIFFGGGTPSVLPPEWIVQILKKIQECFFVRNTAEITIEVNPGTVSEQALYMYRNAGINRLSIGLQSFQEKELKYLGRIHTPEQFLDTFSCARKVGFTNINVDIMSALPEQTMSDYRNTVEKVLELRPEHVSAYSLIVEEGTPFYEMQLNLPDEDVDRQMYQYTERILNAYGYERYEISNYAKPGYECRHNVAYWRRLPYVGFGIGAASMVDNVRWKNVDDLECVGEKENIQKLTKEEQMEEFMFLGLRMTKGVSRQEFHEQFQVPIEDIYGKVLSKMEQLELLENGDWIRLTRKGLDVSNYVMSEFLID
ncbi:MAG: oxygen-independent coproporphyrinogen III oxidase [Lachnospiraceae bacterium]|nr:oxygen-independent coproporphyrinogen III oxidase [Lachnospiraceae bacterium]